MKIINQLEDLINKEHEYIKNDETVVKDAYDNLTARFGNNSAHPKQEVVEHTERDNEEICMNKDRENAWLCVGCKHMTYDKCDFYPTCGKQ